MQEGGRKRQIICIVGETASGKDNLTDMVSRETGIPKVVSYTDAPKRTDQTEGKEHYFLTPEQFDKVLKEQTVIAYTKIGETGYRYCATLEAITADKVLYIIDPAGVSMPCRAVISFLPWRGYENSKFYSVSMPCRAVISFLLILLTGK